MQVRIKKLHPDAVVPRYATPGAACFDLHAVAVDGYEHTGSAVYVGSPVLCGTGLAFEVPAGHVMLIFSRSGHGFNHATRLANCVGVIDSDYRGEVHVKLTCDDPDAGDRSAPLLVAPGDRIAQAMIVPAPAVAFVEADNLASTERGAGGFGSTGV